MAASCFGGRGAGHELGASLVSQAVGQRPARKAERCLEPVTRTPIPDRCRDLRRQLCRTMADSIPIRNRDDKRCDEGVDKGWDKGWDRGWQEVFRSLGFGDLRRRGAATMAGGLPFAGGLGQAMSNSAGTRGTASTCVRRHRRPWAGRRPGFGVAGCRSGPSRGPSLCGGGSQAYRSV